MKKNIIISLLCLIIISCAAYSPPTTPYTYTTNTQTSHKLTGLRIINKGKFDPLSSVASMGGADKSYYYIDGRLVGKFAWTKSYDSLVQLPPGEHELVVTTWSGSKYIYIFHLNEGQIGSFKSVSIYDGWKISKPPFNNVKSWKKIE